MNKLAVITAFLGGVRNRYITYKPDRTLEEKFAVAAQIEGLDGLELCYPADFEDVALLKSLLTDYGFGVSAVNVRSRRTGKWLRGAFTSASAQERAEVVDDFRRAMDLAMEIGAPRISTCPLNDGHDYVFEMNYLDAYRYAEETFAAICEHNRDVKVCIEYKWNDPRTRCLLASAGEALAFCQAVGAENLGVTLDIGHALLAGERPAQSVALLARAGKLFYVHLNDNDRNWDWDMIPGAFHLWEFVEFLYFLREVGYTNDWYAYDVMSKEMDTVETFNTVTHLTRKLESLVDRLDRQQMAALMAERNPAKTLRYLYDTVLPG
ncbi:MAG TPA: sugar phosphate isomerase/epimerase [Caldilineae bacterium]|nr:sugar phosphate isomerase/epimerase [Caldilineae bacterium]